MVLLVKAIFPFSPGKVANADCGCRWFDTGAGNITKTVDERMASIYLQLEGCVYFWLCYLG
jgi:hypothetical protein